MIGGLQGDFGDLDIKYLKQNISKCRSQISRSFRRTPRHCAKWLQNSPGKRYQRIRICLTEEVETPSFPIRRQAPDVKYPENVERHPARIPDVGYPENVERHPARILDVGYLENVERHPAIISDVGYPENVERHSAIISDVGYSEKMERRKGDCLHVHGVGTHPEQLHPNSPRGHAIRSNSIWIP